MEELKPSGVRDWVEGQLDHLGQAVPESPGQDARDDVVSCWAITRAQVLELVDEFVNIVVRYQIRTLTSYTQASGYNSMMAKSSIRYICE